MSGRCYSGLTEPVAGVGKKSTGHEVAGFVFGFEPTLSGSMASLRVEDDPAALGWK
jgi:hypothetical protein